MRPDGSQCCWAALQAQYLVVRRLTAWTVVVPMMLAGVIAAHSLAYSLVYPEAEVRWQVLALTGHGYLGYTPVALGIIGAVVLIGLLSAVADSARGRRPRPVPAWGFALLPLIGFTVQEFTERWLAGSTFPWWMVLQPTFRVGLLLQLPFGLLAYLAARLLLRTAQAIGAVMRPPLTVSFVRAAAQGLLSSLSISVPRLGIQCCGWGLRGPPLPLA